MYPGFGREAYVNWLWPKDGIDRVLYIQVMDSQGHLESHVSTCHFDSLDNLDPVY